MRTVYTLRDSGELQKEYLSIIPKSQVLPWIYRGCIEEYIKFRRERRLQEESVSNDVEMQSEIEQPASNI